MMELTKMEKALLKVAVANYGKQTIEAMDAAEEAEDWITHEELSKLDDEIAVLFAKLKADMLDTQSGKMYFAEYKDINSPVVAMFDTAAERDKWVNFKDGFSLAFGTTAENATFKRAAITGADAAALEAYVRENSADLNTSVDLDFDNLVWIEILGGEME